jgi:hypothetical protein
MLHRRAPSRLFYLVVRTSVHSYAVPSSSPSRAICRIYSLNCTKGGVSLSDWQNAPGRETKQPHELTKGDQAPREPSPQLKEMVELSRSNSLETPDRQGQIYAQRNRPEQLD